jgi:RimJ/RimL family protein N-acetyltransferase
MEPSSSPVVLSFPGDMAAESKRALVVAAIANAQGDAWSKNFVVTLGGRGDQSEVTSTAVIRPLKPGDEEAMVQFGLKGLSDASRGFFGPYGWTGPHDTLIGEFSQSIGKSQSKQDLHLVVEDGNKIIAHAFLWSAQDDVPELGLAVADEWHGRGLGSTLLLFLECTAKAEGRKALELTTMQTNDVAYRAYIRAGYEDQGIIRNPIGVDVTAAFRGEVIATEFCDERSLVLILDEESRESVLTHIAGKIETAAKIFGEPPAQ